MPQVITWVFVALVVAAPVMLALLGFRRRMSTVARSDRQAVIGLHATIRRLEVAQLKRELRRDAAEVRRELRQGLDRLDRP